MKIRLFLEDSVMRVVILLSAVISMGHGIKRDGFRAKYGNGTTPGIADNKDYFFKLPRTVEEAKTYGYDVMSTEVLQGGHVMYCAPGRIICPLFLNTSEGNVAGLQVAAPEAAIPIELKPDLYFDKWDAPAWKGEPPQTFWTATQFYITNGTPLAMGSSILEDGVLVKGLDGKWLKIPTKESELEASPFKKQNCVPNMGKHYYYNMTRELTCDEPMLPWFPLISQGELLGVGFQTFGDKSMVKVENTHKDWFENIPRLPRTTPLRAIPDAPECFLDKSVKYGRLSIHIYFIAQPWKLTCEPKDSVNHTLALDPDSATQAPTTPKSKEPKNEPSRVKSPNYANPTGDMVQSSILMALGLFGLVMCL